MGPFPPHYPTLAGIASLMLITLTAPLSAQHEMVHGLSLEAPPRPVSGDQIDAMAQQTGAQWVAVIPYAFCRSGETTVHYNTERQWWGEREEGVRAQIQMAHQAGLRVMLKPQLWVPRLFTGHLEFRSQAEWEAWEAGYEAYILDFVELAAQEKVDAFCIGTELCASVRKRPQFWETLILKCRERYSGKLTYAANWDTCWQPRFWNQLDAVGVNAYFPIRGGNAKRAWAGYQSMLSGLSRRTGKPVIFTEFGYRSVEGTLQKPWEEPNGRTVSTESQREALEALFASFWADPPKWFAGGFLWKWKLREGVGGASDAGYTIQGKPALEVVRQAYDRPQS